MNTAPSFAAGNGIVTTDISGTGLGETANAIVVQADGKILVSGSSPAGQFVARYNADGTLDASLGAGGIVTRSGASGNGMVVQSDGKIVVVGTSSNGADTDIALVRYDRNGTIDASFGSSGSVN